MGPKAHFFQADLMKNTFFSYPLGISFYIIFFIMVLERATRFELATSSLGSLHSTPELRPPKAILILAKLRRYVNIF